MRKNSFTFTVLMWAHPTTTSTTIIEDHFFVANSDWYPAHASMKCIIAIHPSSHLKVCQDHAKMVQLKQWMKKKVHTHKKLITIEGIQNQAQSQKAHSKSIDSSRNEWMNEQVQSLFQMINDRSRVCVFVNWSGHEEDCTVCQMKFTNLVWLHSNSRHLMATFWDFRPLRRAWINSIWNHSRCQWWKCAAIVGLLPCWVAIDGDDWQQSANEQSDRNVDCWCWSKTMLPLRRPSRPDLDLLLSSHHRHHNRPRWPFPVDVDQTMMLVGVAEQPMLVGRGANGRGSWETPSLEEWSSSERILRLQLLPLRQCSRPTTIDGPWRWTASSHDEHWMGECSWTTETLTLPFAELGRGNDCWNVEPVMLTGSRKGKLLFWPLDDYDHSSGYCLICLVATLSVCV